VVLSEDLFEKRGESNDCKGWKMAENKTRFVNKLVMMGPSKKF